MTTRRQLLQGAGATAILATIAVPALASPPVDEVERVVWDQSMVGGTPTFIGDVHASLFIIIGRQVAKHRATAIVTTPIGLTIMQSAETSAFTRTYKTPTAPAAPTGLERIMDDGDRRLHEVGLVNKTPVFIDVYGDDEIDIFRGTQHVSTIVIRTDTLSFI